MDTERIERIIKKLNDRIQTHPNFSRLWLNYLDNKLCSLERCLNDCERILDTDMEDDPDVTTIATTYLIARVLTANTT
uniref:Uncharacterized protein n=1 Tax=viral metagenome TaxID=1070528 RepID=A0A6C0CPQ1_9ZZZZ